MITAHLNSFACRLLAGMIGATIAGASLANEPSPAANPTPWTPASLRQALGSIPAGDAARGEKAHAQYFCASCHGEKGVAPTLNWPHLAGQKAAYTAKMLIDYKSGLRREGKRAELMHDVAVMMSPQEIADVSAFYAAQPSPQDDGTPRPQIRKGEEDADPLQLVRKGDRSRLITPCASCHGTKGQGGKREAAALAGQNPLYLVRTLLHYQTGVRANDTVKGMHAFAKKLRRGEIEALAVYYADLPRR